MPAELVPASTPATLETPSAIDRDRELSPAARAAVARGVPDSTRAAYKKDFDDFTDWCAENGRTALPATAETLTEYATHLAYRAEKPRSPSSIERIRSAIRAAHRSAGVEPPDTLGLAKVVKGYRAHLAETKDPRARPRQATAATKDALTAMVNAADRSSPAGLRDTAIVLLGLCTAGRRSEVAALDIGDIVETKEGLTVSVYRRKTRTHQDVSVPYARDPDLCPVLATKEWLEFLAAQGRTEGPLFVRINRHGHLGPRLSRDGIPIGDPSGRITAQGVSQAIARLAKKAGLSGKWSGHSVRRGFATEARKAGHDQIRISRDGGWAEDSPVLARYIADADRWTDNALKGVL